MKNKSWTVIPFFGIFSVVMLFMAFYTFQYSQLMGYIEVSISIITMGVTIYETYKFKSRIYETVRSAFRSLHNADAEYLERFRFPVVLVDDNGAIIWYNQMFLESPANMLDPSGEDISDYISHKRVADVLEKAGTDIECNGRKFTVYANTCKKGTLLYFFDNTYFKNIEEEYSESRSVVASIAFDNREEFINENEEESARVLLTLENTLQRWAANYKALYKKLSGGRYMIIFQERDIQKLVEEKFKILDEIRTIKYNDLSATISIGVGRYATTAKESEMMARAALDMALGRGGDQAAVMKSDGYEFFGGVSQGVEKRSKVRTRVIANAMRNYIAACDKVFIMGHRYSDLDCVGAAVGLHCMITKALEKPAFVVINKEKTMAKSLIDMIEENEEEDVFKSPSDVSSKVTPNSLLIVVDTHSPSFLESESFYKQFEKVIVIDHHRKMVNYISNTLIFYHESTASSASEMCAEIINYLAEKCLTSYAADALMAGIMLDTKNFIVKTGARTFEAAAFLRRRGADTVAVKKLFSENIKTYKEKYKLVSASEIYRGCAVAFADDTIKDPRLVAAQAADELLGVQDVSASFVLFMTNGNTANISARSYGKINVQVIMEKLGGGGHQTMAATQMPDTSMESARQQLFDAIDDFLA